MEYVVSTTSALSHRSSSVTLAWRSGPWYSSTFSEPGRQYRSISPRHWITATTGQITRVALDFLMRDGAFSPCAVTICFPGEPMLPPVHVGQNQSPLGIASSFGLRQYV